MASQMTMPDPEILALGACAMNRWSVRTAIPFWAHAGRRCGSLQGLVPSPRKLFGPEASDPTRNECSPWG